MPLQPSTDLAARAADSAAHEHDPRILWPGLDPAAYDIAIQRIVAVTREALAGRSAIPLAAEGAAELYGRAAFRLGVGALLGRWIEDGIVVTDERTGAVFAAHLAHGRRRGERLAAEAARVTGLLDAAGVTPVLLKGADAARFYPEPGARAFQDIDLFVPASQADATDRVMTRLGFVPGPLRAGRRRDWYAPGAVLHSLELTHADNPWGVDVHFGLGRVFHRALLGELPDPDPATCPTINNGGRDIRVAPPALRLAFLALHASATLRLLQLSHLVDLVFVARAMPAGAWDELVALLAAAGSTRFAYPTLTLAERLAPGCIPAGVRESIEAAAHRRLRRATRELPLTGLARPDRWNGMYALMWAATPREALLVLWRQLLPDRTRTTSEHLAFQRRLVTKMLRGEVGFGVRPDS